MGCARKRGAGRRKGDENQPSELQRPISEPAGSMNLFYAKLTCVRVWVGLHMFVESVHSFLQMLKGLHSPKQVRINLSLDR